MTDNDIIKALGYCFAVGDCEHCIYVDKPCQELMADALALINRQKAEIESLKLINSTYEVDASHIRNVSIKLFVWNLKNCLKKRTEYDEGGWSVDLFTVTEEDIDNLVKEMTEDNNA